METTPRRRVFVTLELETTAPLDVLKDAQSWTRCESIFHTYDWECFQAIANVAKKLPKRKKAKVRKGRKKA